MGPGSLSPSPPGPIPLFVVCVSVGEGVKKEKPMALPPIHRIDHEPTFISPLDDAWDTSKIEAEEAHIASQTEDNPAPWQTIEEHPMTRYWSGESRGDLSTVKAYLRDDRTPTVFKLRRLNLNHWAEVEQLRERGLHAQMRIALVRYGVTGIENCDLKLSPPLTLDNVDDIRQLLGDTGFAMLAHVIYGASKAVVSLEAFV